MSIYLVKYIFIQKKSDKNTQILPSLPLLVKGAISTQTGNCRRLGPDPGVVGDLGGGNGDGE